MHRILLLLVAFASLPMTALAEEPCATPRGAVISWVENLQQDSLRPAAATQCFDWSGGPTTGPEREQAARDLLSVLDGQGKLVVYANIPGEADHVDESSGLERYTLFATLPEIFLERTAKGWFVSAGTVAATDALFRSTYLIPLDRVAQRLPSALRADVFGVQLWRLLGLGILLLLCVVVGRLVQLFLVRGFRRLLNRFIKDWDARIESDVLRRLNLLVSSGLGSILLPNLGLPVRLNQILFIGLKVTASVAAVLIVNSLADLAFDAWRRHAAETHTKMDDQLIPLLRRAARLLVYLVGGLFVLQNLDVNVGSLLAGLGLGGLAFALAAKDTLANFFGSLTIFADRPFQIGDWVVIGDVEGTVEEVGFRSTRVRTFYDSLMTLPNSKIADSVIDNMGQRRYRRFKATVGLTYDTTPAQMQAFVEGVRASIVASDYTRKDTFEVHFHTMGASSLDILVYAFFEVASWTDELAGRHALQLEWMRLAEDLGVAFAFPTQTLHVETLAESRTPRPAVPVFESLGTIVDGYGPGGTRSHPRATLIAAGHDSVGDSERGGGGE
jgi:MscS family membrane protein